MKHLHGDHDAHVETWDQQLWKDWPPEVTPDISELTPQVTEAHEDRYVISKSDSIEHLYWRAMPLTGLPAWGTLANATQWTRNDINANREPDGGFWMTLERAQELEG